MISQSSIYPNKNLPNKYFQSEFTNKSFQIEQNKIQSQQQQQLSQNKIDGQKKSGIQIISSNFGNKINNQTALQRSQDYNQFQPQIQSLKMVHSLSQTTNQDQQHYKQNLQQLNPQKNLILHQVQQKSLGLLEPQKNNFVCKNNSSINFSNQIVQKHENQQKLKVILEEQHKRDYNFAQPITQRNNIKEPNYLYVDQSLFQKVYQQRPLKSIPDIIEQDNCLSEDPMVTQLYICWNCHNLIQQKSIILNCLHRYHIECILEIVQNQIQSGQILIKCNCQKKIPFKQVQQILSEQKQYYLQILDKSIFNNLIKQLPKSVKIQDQINFSNYKMK